MCLGGHLVLECDTNSSVLLLEWSITFNSPSLQHTEMRSVDSLGSAQSQSPFIINHTEFQFLRTSVSPLISTMIVNNVSTVLNGTRVDCRYNEMTSTTFIRVTRNGTKLILLQSHLIISLFLYVQILLFKFNLLLLNLKVFCLILSQLLCTGRNKITCAIFQPFHPVQRRLLGSLGQLGYK